ncbi:MAG: amino acid adenylation domain-containing protein [Cyanobacteria bacterium P01_D01_bin.156]
MSDNATNLSQQVDEIAAQSNLTTGQILLWLGQKLNPDSPLYNMVFSFTIQGEIEPVHFQRAFQQLVNHCDILRLTIVESDGIPQQQVAPHLEYTLPFIDFSKQANPSAASKQWMREQSTKLLNLQTCLFDSALLQLASDRFIWHFNQHHLITDNWSVSLLYRRLQEYYAKSLSNHLADVAELPAYAKYATSVKEQQPTWQQQSISHWQQKQKTLPLAIPLYGQSTETATTRTERTCFELGPERSQALRSLAQTPEAQTLSIHQSQFNLFLTLVFAYLYRISGNTELAIAAPAHNRPTPVLKNTPGVFMELFPLQVEISPKETFTSLLKKVAQESMAFLRYAQSGVSHHGMARNVNVVLSYINVTFPDFAGRPVHTDWIHSGYGDSQHHLRLEVQDFDATGNFTLQFDFNCDLISDNQRQWATEHFCKLLDAWLQDGQQLIGAVNILAEEESSLLSYKQRENQEPLDPGSKAASIKNLSVIPTHPPLRLKTLDVNTFQNSESAHAPTLITEFQRQVDCCAGKIAVVFGNETLTYGELDHQTNQLAHYLIQQGVTKGSTVGLFMERSMAMLVAILGVLKTGTAYVPIDPAYPVERTQFMVEDGQIFTLLTQRSLVKQGPTAKHILIWEEHYSHIKQQSTDSPAVDLTPEDLAYILFTSGSTGKPKGVMVEHRNVLAMVRGFEQTASTRDTLTGTALCSYGFDVSVWEVFSNLCFGGTLHLLPADVVTSGLGEYLTTHEITSAYIPPALLPLVIQTLEKYEGDIPLDRILVGVEPIQQQLLQRYRQRMPQLRIVNGYGPTETTICATFYSFDTITKPEGITPIGRALPGYEVYLVNPQGQQVPVGVKGEIVIGGAGLSRGYVNRPDLMAQRFVDNPFGPGKLYKTGDQARYLLDGNLEFLGRLDAQVKIRGFRVELSEVETVFGQHPDIQQAVVLAKKIQQDRLSLIAYLTVKNPIRDSVRIRAFLQQKLPDYMVPSAFVVLDDFPITPNGKVDRRQLASPAYEPLKHLGGGIDHTAPTSAWETYMTNLWATCLRVDSIGIHDNFFDLGGDSITAIQIAAQATEKGIALSPQQILQHPTVANVLSQVETVQNLVADPLQSTEPVPLTPVQKSFFEQVTVEPHHWNQSLILESKQPIDPAMLETALQQLVRHHAILRYAFTLEESGWCQQLLTTEPGPLLHYVDLSKKTAADQARLMVETEVQLQNSLELATGRLLQAALFNLGNNQPSRLVLIIHHLAVDALSWLTLLNDLESFYKQAKGETPVPPLPTTAFPAWATALAKTAEKFTPELSHWLKLTQTVIYPLPKDAEVAHNNTVASVQTITTTLDKENTSRLLKDLPKASRAQVNEILLTALTRTLGGRLLVDLEGHGREESVVPGVNLVRTVGWFTTVYPLLLTLPQSDIREQLQAVKEQLRAVPNRGMGYGVLRYVSDDPDVKQQLEAVPQAEILFNYLGDLAALVPAGSMFQMVRELQLSRSAKGERRYVLEINAAVVKGQLQMECCYSCGIHRQATVQTWADEVMEGVRSQIAHYLSPNASQAATVVDFPLANLNNQKLGKIAALLNKVDRGG